MNKNQANELTNDVLIADILIRIKTLETLLINKKVFTDEEFRSQMKDITELLTMTIIQKSNVISDTGK